MTDYTEEYWKQKERADLLENQVDGLHEELEAAQENDAVTLRPELQRFAFALERRLRKNDHKGGWQFMSVEECLDRALDEQEELAQELSKDEPSLKNVRHEIEDRVNFLLFAWNNAGEEFE